MCNPLRDCSPESSPDSLRPSDSGLLPALPFDHIYVAPDAALHADELAAPPRVRPQPDGSLWLYTDNKAGEHEEGSQVLRIDHIAPFALVHVLEEILSGGSSAYVGYVVHESALSTAQEVAAARIRGQYGETLTPEQVAETAGVVRHTVYAALRAGRLEGSKAHGWRWTITPEQVARWLLERRKG